MMEYADFAPVLQRIAVDAAASESFDTTAIAKDLGSSEVELEMTCDALDAMGLILWSREEPDLPPLLRDAGRQYLSFRGEVPISTLYFLPSVIDDLHARGAMLRGGRELVAEFRQALLAGEAVDHAKELAPPAFAEAITDRAAVDLFCAAVALMARLSANEPAGCVAEEIVAVRLLEEAEAILEMSVEHDSLSARECERATGALSGIFELFEDDDVYALFEMHEPADAALAGNSVLHQQMGVADLRIEAWFYPFGGVSPTGYLKERPA